MRSIILLLITSRLIFGCSQQVTEIPQTPSPEVDVSQPIRAIITEWDEYTGRFSPVKQVEIRARVSGYLKSVNFKDGQMVQKGDVLFVMTL